MVWQTPVSPVSWWLLPGVVTMNRADLCNKQDTVEMTAYDFRG